ncbi:C40 family peptidase [Chryseolinea sp. T2]|uniref:C40 family peptidase n=1 Tax=Chryseolinea sp. T2 TaxID=3129255 RepID=UPI0030771041
MNSLIVVLSSMLYCLPGSGRSAESYAQRLPSSDTTAVNVQQSTPNHSVINPAELITYAQSFKGVPYKYASADPEKGFDCSGFVLYVFKHFNVNVPRSSSAFAKIGKRVTLDEAQPGDIILFTGPKSGTTRAVGHVGIVTEGGTTISFIHATSGKAYSVIETAMTPHYRKRFVKIVRVLS